MTSIDYLFTNLWNTDKDKLQWHSILKQAKEMHKQEIIDAVSYGNQKELMASQKLFAEQYYNEIF